MSDIRLFRLFRLFRLTAGKAAALEALVVHRVARDGELLDHLRGPSRNCTARSEFTLYLTAIVAARL